MEEIVPVNERVSRELDPETLQAPMDLSAIYGNDNPLEVEIGIGKGLFIQHAAQENPEHNFLGIEIRRKYLNHAKLRVEKRPIENVRFFCGEAFELMEKFISPNSIRTIHIYFPDPWPKKRHHKRRLFSDEFIKLVHTLLEPNGELLIATDHYDYWEWISEVLDKQTLLNKTEALPEPAEGTDGLTNYGIKYMREGRPIYRIGYQKPAS